MKTFVAASAVLLAAGAAHAAAPPPDCSGAEYRQFDFWIGEFEVRSADGATWATVFDGSYQPRK